ncbi:microfibrillar-associated protein 1 [Histomonas meleagridis]|uniref:microfibrillar-associated protein 1 n=1 Tax=Histomonas meleagridis TaxID=135588 RepID=UPI003559C342|nr:microfibrillar-associated protein 1 [Histomonas meleagridis]KAH0802991.1 microfibrillar-associated protein 1 [Histomonas meleagridis]
MNDYYSDYSESEPLNFAISFVDKDQRKTIAVEETESESDESENKKRQKESRKLAKEIAKEESASDIDDIDPFTDPPAPETNDFELNQEEEYKLWVEREIGRLKDELRLVAQVAYDAAKTKQQQSMSDLELAKLKKQHKKKRGHMKLMQKYYHVGAFTKNTTSERAQELLQRDFTTAVGDDLMDKTALPKEMYVRGDDYGKKGRTKWTHLTNEDTTTRESRHEQALLRDLDRPQNNDVYAPRKREGRK